MNRLSKRAVVVFAVILILALFFFSGFIFKRPAGKVWKLPTGSGTAAVKIGDSHGVILASDGSLWTWGETGLGWHVLGLGSAVTNQACLARIGLDTNWVDVAVGGSTTLALKSDGTLWAWGQNIYGQLGDGSFASERAAPVRSVPGRDWKQMATAGSHSVALKRDGTLWSWGNNWAGQLGDGTTNNSRAPLRVGSSTNWIRIWANLIENVGQQADGSLWFWGWDYGRSQKGSSIPIPTRVSPDTNWINVGLGDWMVFGIKSDGTLWAWGREAYRYSGAANANADSSPARVGTDSDWRACASFAGSYPVFMKRDGSLWALDASGYRGVATVTTIVSGLVTNNQLSFMADSTTLGGDPAIGRVKSLQITYQLAGASRTNTFAENSTVSLGGPGQTLSITRALYGDPTLVRNAAGSSARDLSIQPAQLRPINLPTNVVAFCAGRHRLGAALTSDGEVWTWGEALGQHTRSIPLLQHSCRLLNRLGVNAHWGESGPVILQEPAKLETSTVK